MRWTKKMIESICFSETGENQKLIKEIRHSKDYFGHVKRTNKFKWQT